MLHRAKWVLPFLFCVTLAAASCGDDEPQGACSLQDGSGCVDGLTCQAGPDGVPGCFCSPDANTGCDDGLECQTVDGAAPGCFCSPSRQSGCGDGQVCEVVEQGNTGCFPPVLVRGMVFDLQTDAAVPDARVVARDANNVAVSAVAISDAMGMYELAVPTTRTADGTLVETNVTLRADAAGYVTFPTAPRSAIPFDTANAAGDPLVLQTSATDIALIPLADATGLGSVSGTVLADQPRGTLVVVGGQPNQGGGVTGIADLDGTYTVFNVPAGTHDVRGYAAGLQLASASATVTAGQETTGVDLGDLGAATAEVSGKIDIVNPGDGSDTSVILVVDETFVANTASGEAPPGLRAFPVNGAFSIPYVPDGNYVVLAAFENDFLVRDPDTCIGGTDIVRITVSGGNLAISEGFKVTGSLAVISPDNEETVSAMPDLVWEDDSGEDHYEVVVYDAYGNLIWEKLDVPGVSGSKTVTQPYEGPALTPGTLYQFRATSIKNGGCPISRTEDLKGVFLFP